MTVSYDKFKKERAAEVQTQSDDASFREQSRSWIGTAQSHRYSYHFEWLGRPIIQYPQDIVAMQEIIWSVQPDLIIETGIAHGGSLIFYASLLELNAICGGPQDAEVMAVDIEIRPHNREYIEAHPLFERISMIEGSSTAPEVVRQITERAERHETVLVCLDSNHTHDHVLAELHAYAPLVSPGSYCIVFDTIVEQLPESMSDDRPWGPGNNPETAIAEFLRDRVEFVVDEYIERKLMVTVAPGGYLRRVE